MQPATPEKHAGCLIFYLQGFDALVINPNHYSLYHVANNNNYNQTIKPTTFSDF